MHIAASVFIIDDESGLHHDYEVLLEGLAPHAAIDHAAPEAGCTTGRARTPVANEVTGHADAHLKRNETGQVAHDGPPSAAVVVAVTNGCLDGSTERSTELAPRARRDLWHLGADLLQRNRWAAAEVGAGQDYRGVGVLRAVLSAGACGSAADATERWCVRQIGRGLALTAWPRTGTWSQAGRSY
jgi:hypothetical protein